MSREIMINWSGTVATIPSTELNRLCGNIGLFVGVVGPRKVCLNQVVVLQGRDLLEEPDQQRWTFPIRSCSPYAVGPPQLAGWLTG